MMTEDEEREWIDREWLYKIKITCDDPRHAPKVALVGRFGRDVQMGWMDARLWGDRPPRFLAGEAPARATSGVSETRITGTSVNNTPAPDMESDVSRWELSCPMPRCWRIVVRDRPGAERLFGALDLIEHAGRRRATLGELAATMDEMSRG